MKSKCVLLAEDDENDVLFLQRAFRQAEITAPLQVTHDGQEAINYLSGLDLKMPRKNGMEALEWIRGREDLRALPVIIFSSSVHPEEINQAYRLGASAFLTKPSGVKERLELAQRIKRSWIGLASALVGLGAGFAR
jgi:CheY-like chemotaxis protein